MKTTIYLPEGLDLRLEARAASSGTSKAELVRRAVTRLLDDGPAEPDLELPVFDSGRERTATQMKQDLVDQIGERAARR